MNRSIDESPKDLCCKCKKKSALTKCLKGCLCFVCGQQCHGMFQHPVEFLIHAPREEGMRRGKTVKSMVMLTKTNLAQPPLRLSKVDSRIRLGKKSQSIMSQSKFSKKDTTLLSLNPRVKQSKLKIKQKVQQLKQKKSSLHSSIASKENQEPVINLNEQKEEELQKLRIKVADQAEVIELMKKRLEKEKKKNREIQTDYQEKLKIIRNMRN